MLDIILKFDISRECRRLRDNRVNRTAQECFLGNNFTWLVLREHIGWEVRATNHWTFVRWKFLQRVI